MRTSVSFRVCASVTSPPKVNKSYILKPGAFRRGSASISMGSFLSLVIAGRGICTGNMKKHRREPDYSSCGSWKHLPGEPKMRARIS